jgi:Tfp pilus assembly protein PilV
MSLETLILSVGLLGALQVAYRTLKNMEARTVTGSSAWNADGASDFFLETDEDRAARQMKKDFDLARAKGIMAMASEFAEKRANA